METKQTDTVSAAVEAIIGASLARHLFVETVRRNVLERRIPIDRKRFSGRR